MGFSPTMLLGEVQYEARSFLLDVLECPRCSGWMKLIALIEEPRVIRENLEHLGLLTAIPSLRPARSPPLDWDEPEPSFC